MRRILILMPAVCVLAGGGEPAAIGPWSSNTHPADVAKTHTEEIAAAPHTYTIVQGGTMDGRSCRSPMGCGMAREGAFFQAWESNRWVRLENVGETDLVNPWLSNGRNEFRSVKDIVAAAIAPGMTDAEKAFALWFQEIRYRHHSGGDNNELGDPVKVFNIYGYNTCGNDSICLATLWRAAGLRAAPARALGHCISQAYHDGGWHFYDGDIHCVYLLRDNETVAGEQDIVRDHDLVKRTHSQGILFPDTWWQGQGMPSMYFYEGEVTGERGGKADTTMGMVLRPGEAIVWRWGQTAPVKYHGALHTMPTYDKATHLICDGLWEYRPDLSKETWRRGAQVENVRSSPEGLAPEEGTTGKIVWTMASPYVFVGGRIEAEGSGARFFLSQDGKTWKGAGSDLDGFFSTVGPAWYRYQLRCELAAGARLRRLAIINDIQMAPLALPDMAVGANAFTYSDENPGERKVKITHAWVERSIARPPAAPPGAIDPPDGGESDGTDIAFRWKAPDVPGGGAIGDYHFELSRRADMRMPLSMDFYKLISRTADATVERDRDGVILSAKVKAQYTLAQPGLLTPDRTYYWRVRAMSDAGVWGPWSATWSFTARGVACPVDVAVDYDRESGVGTLRWKADPGGTRPAKYRVYGSEEKGFTVGDQNYQGTVGVSKEDMAAWNPWFPANFIAETAATRLAVIGPGVELAAANKTYYRVVAVDDRGKRSGPSDYAAAPRPIIYSTPVATAKVGEAYAYQVRANRSLGDLSARMKDGEQVSGYFDIEKPRYALAKGPSWAAIDAATGVLAGTPDAAGRTEIEVTATIDREVRKLDVSKLVWGIEKVQSVAVERVGVATQRFVLDVRARDAAAAAAPPRAPRTPGRGPRIFMHWDMEGASGLFTKEQAWYWEKGVSERAAEQGRDLLIADVTSAARAALDAGAAELIICDTHHGGGNFQTEKMLSDPRITYLWRSVGVQDGKRRWMPGLDESVDGLMLMAHHAKAGTDGAFLPHTQDLAWADVRINGQSVGEMGIEGCYAGHWNIPLVLVQGDEAACREAEEQFPGVVTAAVKRAEGHDRCAGPDAEAARQLTARKVAEAVAKLRAGGSSAFKPFEPALPMTVTIRMTAPADADAAAKKPGVRRIDPLTIEARVDRRCDVIKWLTGHGLDMPEPAAPARK